MTMTDIRTDRVGKIPVAPWLRSVLIIVNAMLLEIGGYPYTLTFVPKPNFVLGYSAIYSTDSPHALVQCLNLHHQNFQNSTISSILQRFKI